MIKRPTVFVLGAGASFPYGFPLGSGLRDIVIDPTRGYPKGQHYYWSKPDRLAEDFGLGTEYIAFVQKLRLSGYPSVDQFLEKNPVFTDVGRLAIAAALLPCESNSGLFPPRAPRDHWFEVFANILNVGEQKYLRNRVTIITYNYDRSLENYLVNVMRARLPQNSRALRRHFEHIPIIHLHGRLGRLGTMVDDAKGTVPYGHGGFMRDAPAAIRIAMREISVIHTVNPTTDAFIAARKALEEAERIYFLGFGYNATNLDRLQIFRKRWTPERRARCIVRGTSKGPSVREWKNVCMSSLGEAMHPTPRHRGGIAAFLRNVVDVD
jgi:hypothetical protein